MLIIVRYCILRCADMASLAVKLPGSSLLECIVIPCMRDPTFALTHRVVANFTHRVTIRTAMNIEHMVIAVALPESASLT